MTLLVDVGNSAIKWTQLSSDGSISAAHMLVHRDALDITGQLANQWRDSVVDGTAVVACNVARPEVVAAVDAAARALQLRPVRWLTSQRRFVGTLALDNGYRNWAQLGADRWHCMLGAFSWLSTQGVNSSFVVVNAGTATTVDCVQVNNQNANSQRLTGKFVGGVIAPGVRPMLESLSRQTAGLPTVDVKNLPATDFPDNTDAAIVTGVLDAQAGLIELIRRRLARRQQAEPRLILTGGHAEAVSARLQAGADIEHNLVLRGLALRAQTDEY